MIKKISLRFCMFITVLILISFHLTAQDKNWTHFRGSSLNGLSNTNNIPLKWDNSVIKWKKEIHGKGYSSPVIWDNQIWVTTASDDGKDLYAVCLNYTSGEIIYDIKVFSPETLIGKHTINTFASPTPCIEKGYVYVHYGSLGTACIKTDDGTIVWQRTDLKCDHVQGPGSSPVLYKNLLILHYEGVDSRYIIALDKSTGKTVWKTDRPEKPYETIPWIGRKAYVTPLILNVKGRDMLISNGSALCAAYDPNTGEEIWRVVRGAESTVPMPFSENGIVYFYCGSMADDESPNYTELIAVNPEGNGDLTATNIIWKKRDNQIQTQMLTPVIKDGLIYTVNTKNILMCIDAASGAEIWSERQRANFNASPVFADGIVWFFSVKGDVVAIKAGRKYEVVSSDVMDSGIWATPAFLRNSVILRTEKYLCRISN